MSKIVLRPESPVTESICVVNLSGDLLTAKLPDKREDFR